MENTEAEKKFADPDYATQEETARFLGVKVPTLYNWRSRGEGPPYTKPNRNTILYPVAGLKRYLAE